MKKTDYIKKDSHECSHDVFAPFAQHYIMESFQQHKAIAIPTLNIRLTDTCASEALQTAANSVPQRTPTSRR